MKININVITFLYDLNLYIVEKLKTWCWTGQNTHLNGEFWYLKCFKLCYLTDILGNISSNMFSSYYISKKLIIIL